jgi:hypothetical protein
MKIFVRAAAIAALAIVSISVTLADRRITGVEAQKALAGRAFQLQCIDGTLGHGFFNTNGIDTVAFKRSAARDDAAETIERAVVQARGDQICVAWKEFDGGGNSCYPVAMKSPTLFRLGVSGRWCDIKAQ